MSAQRGTIDSVLWFWVVVLVALIGAIAVVASGRGDTMAEVYDDRPDATLPSGRPLTADDLREVRLNTGVRGYRMDEVDALLARLEAELIDRDDPTGMRVVSPAATLVPDDRLDERDDIGHGFGPDDGSDQGLLAVDDDGPIVVNDRDLEDHHSEGQDPGDLPTDGEHPGDLLTDGEHPGGLPTDGDGEDASDLATQSSAEAPSTSDGGSHPVDASEVAAERPRDP